MTQTAVDILDSHAIAKAQVATVDAFLAHATHAALVAR